jgi:D-serine deaminase-like pyridoxal phosphate-dependent protein
MVTGLRGPVSPWWDGELQQVSHVRLTDRDEVVDEQSLHWIASTTSEDDSLALYCLVDSLAGVALMEEVLCAAGASRPLHVLVELGFSGGRTGSRTVAQAIKVAEAVRASSTLRLAGVECYEGLLGDSPDAATLDAVDDLLNDVTALAAALDERGLWADNDEVILSGGGSAFFDRVVERFGAVSLSRPARTVLRCGAYVSHDHAMYQELSPFGSRIPDTEALQPAAELWCRVSSLPEPGIAVLNFGKRDSPYDVSLPTPLTCINRNGERRVLEGKGAVVKLNDQHAYMTIEEAWGLEIGDIVGLGMSHPCTIFDKWRALPLVDDDYRVIRALDTYF